MPKVCRSARPRALAVLVDERAHLVRSWSSSVAKNIDAPSRSRSRDATRRPPQAKLLVRRARGFHFAPGRARAHPPHLRTDHTRPPTRTLVRVTSPTIMPGEPKTVATDDPRPRRGANSLTSATWRRWSASTARGWASSRCRRARVRRSRGAAWPSRRWRNRARESRGAPRPTSGTRGQRVARRRTPATGAWRRRGSLT